MALGLESCWRGRCVARKEKAPLPPIDPTLYYPVKVWGKESDPYDPAA
jgi:hypothetical protein